MSHDDDVGYEIFASLFLDSNKGEPLVLGLDLRYKKGILKCQHIEMQKDKTYLEQLIERVSW